MTKLKGLAFFLLSAVLLTGCGASNETNASDSDSLDEVNIMLDWYPNAVHTFLYVAMENGYFEEEGLDVNIIFPANPTDPINLTAAGELDFALSYQPDIITSQQAGLPIEAVAPIVRSPLNHVMFLADKDFKSPRDLEGKTVGYPGIPLNEQILKTMVETDGGDFSKVKMVDIGFELGPAIMTERTDAIIGAYINHEYPVLKHEGYDINYLNPTDYGVPPYYELVLITNEQMKNEQAETVEAFWRAAEKGYQTMKEDPEESLGLLLANQEQANFPLIETVEEESLSILLEKMETDNEAFGEQSDEHWSSITEWLEETKE
ncbi:ABC transporter substrate-binding protein [Alkalihalophilus lindianensis]|uniref:ABC transporter substrate-binding protein n=1 Tax=Alkalihalophilus lindianensis TaxID=1630542 RepID=A0ABU3X6Y6_9BACI|nr:ABC transporter substrate-binding protein [Alkalihalophilus lindianensis]MDV2683028.1 ABC transporter substrate-binding protein [Alkalihalophilus lindianensis]